jgi:hypothetical protein
MTMTTYFLPALIGDDADYVVSLSNDNNPLQTSVWMVPGSQRETAPAPKPTAKISFDGWRYYISYLGRGTRSRKDYKTEAGARRIAISKGEVVDPTPAAYVLPIYLDPTSETYRCA